ncbi:hypothetical protein D3C84_711000 [compost metagenome]
MASIDPCTKVRIAFETGRIDKDITLHGLAGEIHLANVRQGQCLGVTLRPHARHKHIAQNPDKHIAPGHEGQAAKHLSLDDSRMPLKGFPQSFCQAFVVWHEWLLTHMVRGDSGGVVTPNTLLGREYTAIYFYYLYEVVKIVV